MVLVAGRGLCARQSKRLGRIGIERNQARGQAIYVRGPRSGHERRLSGQVCRDRIGREVMIEGNVLLKDDHHMLDRAGRSHRRGARRALRLVTGRYILPVLCPQRCRHGTRQHQGSRGQRGACSVL